MWPRRDKAQNDKNTPLIPTHWARTPMELSQQENDDVKLKMIFFLRIYEKFDHEIYNIEGWSKTVKRQKLKKK